MPLTSRERQPHFALNLVRSIADDIFKTQHDNGKDKPRGDCSHNQ
jgi:hypothetical protein